MPVARLEAMVRADGVGLSGVQRTIRKNRSTFRRMLSLFKTHFTIRNGVVKTAMAAAAPRAETPEERSARLDRQLAESQRLRDEQDRQREERREAGKQRLRGVSQVYGSRPRG
jgi:hypothetical protein